MLKDKIIVFDSNAFLHPYKIVIDFENLYQKLEEYKEKIYMPNTVCREILKIMNFFKEERFKEIRSSFEDVAVNIKNSNLEKAIRQLKHLQSYYKIDSDLLIKEIERIKDEIYSLENEKNIINTLLNSEDFDFDYLLMIKAKQMNDGNDKFISYIMSNNKLMPLSNDEKNIKINDLINYDKYPGFKDKKKKEESKHNDFLIWCEIEKTSISLQKDVIYVSNDDKEWEDTDFKKIWEDKFSKNTNQRINVINTDSFYNMIGYRNEEVKLPSNYSKYKPYYEFLEHNKLDIINELSTCFLKDFFTSNPNEVERILFDSKKTKFRGLEGDFKILNIEKGSDDYYYYVRFEGYLMFDNLVLLQQNISLENFIYACFSFQHTKVEFVNNLVQSINFQNRIIFNKGDYFII